MQARWAYNKHRNICASIPSKSKRSYLRTSISKTLAITLEISNVHIILRENDQLLKNKHKIANIFNNFFINVIPNFRIDVNWQCI